MALQDLDRASPAQPRGRNHLSTRRRRSVQGRGRPTWLVVPAVVILLLVVVAAELLAIYMAFFGISVSNLGHWYQAPFVGLQNFKFVLTNTSAAVASALSAVRVSLEFAVLSTAIATPIGVIAALSVHHKFRGRALFRSFFLIPYVIPVVVVAMVSRIMFANGTGLIDQIMGVIGLNRNTYWLIGGKSFWAMLAVEVWIVWPFTYLMILAGLASVPDELYEAVELDGGASSAKLRHIAWPTLRGILLLSIVLSTIFHLGGFTLPYVMFNNPPPPQVAVLPINVYFRAFSTFQFGDAAATGLLMMVIFAVPAFFYIRATRLRNSFSEGGAT